MKKIMSIAGVALFLITLTGCCCMKGKACSECCGKPCCTQPAE